MLKTGLTQVYMGDNPGTNIVPFGLALRAVGRNLHVHISCFTPYESMDGAPFFSNLLKPNLLINQPAGLENTTNQDWSQSVIDEINHAFRISQEALLGGQFDVVVLNGITRIVRQGIIPLNALIELIQQKPTQVELVLSGPAVDKEVLERADLITELVTHAKQEDAVSDPDDPGEAPAEVVTGNGKGKTTYCLGKALLWSSVGIPTKILQFIKSPKAYGEVRAIEKLPGLEIDTLGEGFLRAAGKAPDRKHQDAARSAWEACLREIFSLEYGLIVLDEINIATRYALVRPDRVREMLFLKPRNLHLILSGRNAHREVMDGASSVIEMKEIKHPLKKGIKARKGIEF